MLNTRLSDYAMFNVRERIDRYPAELMPQPGCQKCDDMSIRLNTVPALDRQTGGQTDGFAVRVSLLHGGGR